MSSPACPRRSRSSPPTRSRSARPRRWRRPPRRPPAAQAAQDQARRRRRSGAHRGGARAPRRSRELIVDANEGWTADNLAENLAACAAAGVTLVEQPLPAGDDAALAAIARPIPVCADESVHDRARLAALVGRYDAVNIKLDKTGGLTEALAMAAEAERLGFAHHGRLHGRDLARHGAGDAAGAARARGRSRRAAAAGEGSPGRATLRGQPGSSADARAVGIGCMITRRTSDADAAGERCAAAPAAGARLSDAADPDDRAVHARLAGRRGGAAAGAASVDRSSARAWWSRTAPAPAPPSA